MARKTKADADQTRQKILTAALDLFVAKGYERATFDDVARRIRLSKGAVYWHFKSKPDLLSELVAHMSARQTELVGRALLPEPVSLDGLVAHFVERARLIAGKPVCRKFFHMMMSLDWSAARIRPIQRRLRQAETGSLTIIEDTLAALRKKGEVRADADIAAASAVLGAMWLGLLKLKIDQCLETDLSQAVGLGFSSVINAIRT